MKSVFAAAALAAAVPEALLLVEQERTVQGFELFIVPQWYGILGSTEREKI